MSTQTEEEQIEQRRSKEAELIDKAILNPMAYKHTHSGYSPPEKLWVSRLAIEQAAGVYNWSEQGLPLLHTRTNHLIIKT